DRGTGVGDLGSALRLRHRDHLGRTAADQRRLRHRQRLGAGDRRFDPRRSGDRGAGVQPAQRAARPATDAADRGHGVRPRLPRGRAGTGPPDAVAGPCRPRLRRRRRHADRPGLRRRACADQVPRPAGAVLPDRHRRRHRHRHPRRCVRERRLAGRHRRGRGAQRADVPADAAPARQPALADQGRSGRARARGAGARAPPGDRRLPRAARHRRTGRGRTRRLHQRLAGPAGGLGAAGADRRVRPGDLHPAVRDRDDRLLLADDPDRQRLLRHRGAPGVGRARPHVPDHPADRAGDHRPRRPAAAHPDHAARRRAGPHRARDLLRHRQRRRRAGSLHHRHAHRVHGLHRRWHPAHGLAHRLRDLPAGHPRGGRRRAVGVPVGHEPAHHPDLAEHHRHDRHRSDLLAVRRLQHRRIHLPVPAHARTHRPQPGADREPAVRGALPAGRLRRRPV
ncbi:MAG: benzoate MFS transporter BenK, partial [uncultured Blastococcus sp.]